MITAIKTTPATVTPQIRPTKILMITAINTRPPTVTPQIRPTKILMITAIITRRTTVTPQIRPTKNTNDYSNQNHPSYCNTTNKTYKKY
jgi:hypothetical protein